MYIYICTDNSVFQRLPLTKTNYRINVLPDTKIMCHIFILCLAREYFAYYVYMKKTRIYKIYKDKLDLDTLHSNM